MSLAILRWDLTTMNSQVLMNNSELTWLLAAVRIAHSTVFTAIFGWSLVIL